MASRAATTFSGSLQAKLIDLNDGTFAQVVAIMYIDGSGNPVTAPPVGRAAAAASSPVVLSNEDKTALDKASAVYNNAALYSGATTAGIGVAIIATVAGTATLTFSGGGSLVVPVAVGLSVYPFGCTNAVQTSGTMTLYKLTS